jgi:hypothetical protein
VGSAASCDTNCIVVIQTNVFEDATQAVVRRGKPH